VNPRGCDPPADLELEEVPEPSGVSRPAWLSEPTHEAFAAGMYLPGWGSSRSSHENRGDAFAHARALLWDAPHAVAFIAEWKHEELEEDDLGPSRANLVDLRFYQLRPDSRRSASEHVRAAKDADVLAAAGMSPLAGEMETFELAES
jgi:hypothetical protein